MDVLAVQDNATEWGSTPDPLREIVAGEFVALLVIVALPITFPADVGANTTFRVAV